MSQNWADPGARQVIEQMVDATLGMLTVALTEDMSDADLLGQQYASFQHLLDIWPVYDES